MVSFQCEGCGDVLTKKKLDSHRNQCYGASYSCLDCMVHFQGTEYRSHTSCISEAQKYQGALYRPEKEKKGNRQNNYNDSKALVPHPAYVEDVPDEYNNISQYEVKDDEEESDPLPAAPSPPAAAPDYGVSTGPVNVFDFLVESATPTTSRLELGAPEPMHLIEDVPQVSQENQDRDLVRVHFGESDANDGALVRYDDGAVPTEHFQTPAPKAQRERKKEKKEKDQTKEQKKDKKRKRLHVDTHDLAARDRDETMTDAPPVLAHSGLTGGLNRLLSRPSVFPPSPDYSGGDGAEPSPGSPLKKTKHSKRGRSRVESISSNLMAYISTRVPPREHSDERPKRKHRKHRESSDRSKQKMLEYKPMNGDAADPSSQMVLFKPRAEMLMSFISKGPQSERGVSMNKALKRYHRERTAMGIGLSKAEEEKELWRSLRMKKNDRGEIVLFM
jgi:cell growth-regulating nucleolar protein